MIVRVVPKLDQMDGDVLLKRLRHLTLYYNIHPERRQVAQVATQLTDDGPRVKAVCSDFFSSATNESEINKPQDERRGRTHGLTQDG